jgi:hypothetical protein
VQTRPWKPVPHTGVKISEARGAAGSIEPGVERSETPGDRCEKHIKPAERPIEPPSNVSFIILDAVRFQELNEFIVK